MMEIQGEFILRFMMPFLSEVHLPLADAKNPCDQDNDVPQFFSVFNAGAPNGESDLLRNLYIENYANTEFSSEEPVLAFLEEVSGFLDEIRFSYPDARRDESSPTCLDWRSFWRAYTIDLCVELFDGFLLGNLITVAAMTRTLIESYGYMLVFDNSVDSSVVAKWLLCSLFQFSNGLSGNQKEESLCRVRAFCDAWGLDYVEMEKDLSRKDRNAWLSALTGKKRTSFFDVCVYVED